MCAPHVVSRHQVSPDALQRQQVPVPVEAQQARVRPRRRDPAQPTGQTAAGLAGRHLTGNSSCYTSYKTIVCV